MSERINLFMTEHLYTVLKQSQQTQDVEPMLV